MNERERCERVRASAAYRADPGGSVYDFARAPFLEVSLYRSLIDGATVVDVSTESTLGPLRVFVNDGAVLDAADLDDESTYRVLPKRHADADVIEYLSNLVDDADDGREVELWGAPETVRERALALLASLRPGSTDSGGR